MNRGVSDFITISSVLVFPYLVIRTLIYVGPLYVFNSWFIAFYVLTFLFMVLAEAVIVSRALKILTEFHNFHKSIFSGVGCALSLIITFSILLYPLATTSLEWYLLHPILRYAHPIGSVIVLGMFFGYVTYFLASVDRTGEQRVGKEDEFV